MASTACYKFSLMVFAAGLSFCRFVWAEQPRQIQQTNAVVRTVAEGDFKQLKGNRLWEELRKIREDHPRFDAAVQTLNGRVMKFTHVPIKSIDRNLYNGKIHVTLGTPGADRKKDYGFAFDMIARFPAESKGVDCLDHRILLPSILVRFAERSGSYRIYCDVLDFEIPPPEDPLAGHSAEKISGVELVDLVYDEGLERRQYAELQHLLEGRRLTFSHPYLWGNEKGTEMHTWPFHVISPREAERARIERRMPEDLLSYTQSQRLGSSDCFNRSDRALRFIASRPS